MQNEKNEKIGLLKEKIKLKVEGKNMKSKWKKPYGIFFSTLD